MPRNLTLALFLLERAVALGHVHVHSNIAALHLLAPKAGEPGQPGDDGLVFNGTAARAHLEIAIANAGTYPAGAARFNLALIALHGWDPTWHGGKPNCRAAYRQLKLTADRGVWNDEGLVSLETALDNFRVAGDGSGWWSTLTGTDASTRDALRTAALQFSVLSALGIPSALDNAAFMMELFPSAAAVFDAAQGASAVGEGAVGAAPPPASTAPLVVGVHGFLTAFLLRSPYVASVVPLPPRHHPDGRAEELPSPAPISLFAVSLYREAAALGVAHAALRLGDCIAEAWPGVPWCHDAGAVGNLTAKAVAQYDTAAAGGLAHARLALSTGLSTGRLGVLALPAHLPTAWAHLQAAEEEDALSGWAVAVQRWILLARWLRDATGAALWGRALPPGTATLGDLAGNLAQCFVSFPPSQEEEGGYLVDRVAPDAPRSGFSSSHTAAAEVLDDPYAPWQTDEEYEADRVARAAAAVAARTKRTRLLFDMGPVRISKAQRTLCTIAVRTVTVAGVLAGVAGAGVAAAVLL